MTIDGATDKFAVSRETEHVGSATYPTIPEWIDLANLSPRANSLMWQNSELLNQAAELINAGDFSPLVWEQLQDIWAEAIDLERKFADERAAGDL